MKIVGKFVVPLTDWIIAHGGYPKVAEFDIDMPQGAQVLTCQTQNGQPCLWAWLETENVKETRRFGMYGTGNDAEEVLPSDYVGTVQLGSYVGHIFDLGVV